MASHRSSEIADAASDAFDPAPLFLSEHGVPAAEPPEWEAGDLILDGIDPSDWRRVVVTRNGIPLEPRLARGPDGDRIVVPWDRASAGLYALAVEDDGRTWEGVLRVRPRKLNDDAFAALVDDLEERLPASIAMTLGRLGAFAGVTWHPPRRATLAQEIRQLRRIVDGDQERPGLIRILERIARDPHTVLADTLPWVRAEQARQPAPAHLAAALGRAGNVSRQRRLKKVVDSRVEPTFDVYENRLVRAFRDQIRQRLRRVRRVLSARPDMDLALVEEMADLDKRLGRACRTSAFLDSVGVLNRAPDRLTQVLLRRPAYRSALDGYLAARRSAAVTVAHPALDAPFLTVPALYEAWGTLAIVDALLAAAAEAGMTVLRQRLYRPDAGGYLSLLPADEPSVVLGLVDGTGTVSLTPQRAFPGGGRSDPGSVSFTQIPDVTVEIQRAGRRDLLLFDPKYKLPADMDGWSGDGSPKKEDIDKMHAYRDAIRDAQGNRLVTLAAILYPGRDARYGDGLLALRAMPGETGLRETARRLLTDALSEA